MRRTTETGRTLIPEARYDNVNVDWVEVVNIKKFVIYEWHFSTISNGEPFEFKLGLFSSQMGELLKALGAIETTPNKFDWDDEDVIGKKVSFNIVHVTDKKGIIREQLSDVVAIADEQKKEQVSWDSEEPPAQPITPPITPQIKK